MQIDIKNLTFETIIGILQSEREHEQRVIIDTKIKYDYTNENFLDYSKIVELIKNTTISEKFLLLEDAIEFLIQKIKKDFPQIKSIKMRISKPDILQDCIVGIKIKKNFKKN
jgi:dihydroneopterin aldolase